MLVVSANIKLTTTVPDEQYEENKGSSYETYTVRKIALNLQA